MPNHLHNLPPDDRPASSTQFIPKANEVRERERGRDLTADQQYWLVTHHGLHDEAAGVIPYAKALFWRLVSSLPEERRGKDAPYGNSLFNGLAAMVYSWRSALAEVDSSML